MTPRQTCLAFRSGYNGSVLSDAYKVNNSISLEEASCRKPIAMNQMVEERTGRRLPREHISEARQDAPMICNQSPSECLTLQVSRRAIACWMLLPEPENRHSWPRGALASTALSWP